IRPAHASEFLGGILAARAVMAALLLGALGVWLGSGKFDASFRAAVVCFALGQVCFVTNNTLAALLHAQGRVSGLSALNLGAKLFWGATVIVCLVLHAGLGWMALAFLVSEAVRTAVLMPLVRHHLGVRFRWKAVATTQVLVASAPLYLTLISQAVSSRLNAT